MICRNCSLSNLTDFIKKKRSDNEQVAHDVLEFIVIKTFLNKHRFNRFISSVFLNFVNDYIMFRRIDFLFCEFDLVSSMLESFDHVDEFIFHFFFHEIKSLIVQFRLLHQSSTDFCFVDFWINAEIREDFVLITQTKSLHDQLNIVVASTNIDNPTAFNK